MSTFFVCDTYYYTGQYILLDWVITYWQLTSKMHNAYYYIGQLTTKKLWVENLLV